MDNSFQTSFIPKKPITPGVPLSKPPRSLFSVIATFILVFVLVVSLGLYVYKIYLTKQKESFSNSLTSARDSFEQGTIDELDLFNKRTEASKELLNKHIVISPIFKLLQEITIPSIQYTSFEQTTDESGFLVKMEGTARDYRSIALQADMFNSAKGLSLKNVVFSNLVKDKSNNIIFDLKFNIDPALLSYEKESLLNSATTTPTTPTTTVPAATTPVSTTTTNTSTAPTTTDTKADTTTTTTNTQEGSSLQGNLKTNTQSQ